MSLRASFRSLLSRDYTLLSGAYSRESTRFFQELTLTRLHAFFQIQKGAPFTAIIQIGTDRKMWNITLNVFV